MTRLASIVDVSNEVAATRARSKKIELLAETLRAVKASEAAAVVSYLIGRPLQRRLNVGYSTVYAVDREPASDPTLEVSEVDAILEELSQVSGPGSKRVREGLLAELFGRATEAEQEFLRGLTLRNLRQGALEGVMADAVAVALDIEPQRVRRAAMLEGDLVVVAASALEKGPRALEAARLQLFTPIQPMLAKTAETAGRAVSDLGEAVVEQKLDGARVQVHKHGDRVAVYTRNLRDVTETLGELVAAISDLPAKALILDGEALWFAFDGTPADFQDSISSFSSEDSGERPLTALYFDCLHLDGVDLIDRPLAERRGALEQAVPSNARVGSVVTSDPSVADRFFEQAVADGFEGVVVKDPGQPYAAGRRGAGWRKVKPTHTLDLVILAAEWGSGRRQGWLSNLHLGALDPDSGEFVMLGKTFKGLTDEMLTWQTERFLEIEERRDRHIVYLRPEIVYEIAFDGVQRSTRYPGGVALRFARVKRHRDDKVPEEADTIGAVREFLRG